MMLRVASCVLASAAVVVVWVWTVKAQQMPHWSVHIAAPEARPYSRSLTLWELVDVLWEHHSFLLSVVVCGASGVWPHVKLGSTLVAVVCGPTRWHRRVERKAGRLAYVDAILASIAAATARYSSADTTVWVRPRRGTNALLAAAVANQLVCTYLLGALEPAERIAVAGTKTKPPQAQDTVFACLFFVLLFGAMVALLAMESAPALVASRVDVGWGPNLGRQSWNFWGLVDDATLRVLCVAAPLARLALVVVAFLVPYPTARSVLRKLVHLVSHFAAADALLLTLVVSALDLPTFFNSLVRGHLHNPNVAFRLRAILSNFLFTAAIVGFETIFADFFAPPDETRLFFGDCPDFAARNNNNNNKSADARTPLLSAYVDDDDDDDDDDEDLEKQQQAASSSTKRITTEEE